MHQVLKNVKALRELAGYSQEYMAESLGLTQSSYARFENEAKKIDFRLIERVAELFGVDTHVLVNFHKQDVSKQLPPNLAQEGQEGYGNPELEQLKDRVEHLERLNEQLMKQLKDKEEIISLLKKTQEQ